MKIKSILISGNRRAELQEISIPEPGISEVLLKADYSCISPGTELRCMNYPDGDANFPYIPGYSVSGTVEKCGDGTSLVPGDKVFYSGNQSSRFNIQWGGHCQYAVCSADGVIPVPTNVSQKEAAITKLAAIAYHGTRVTNPTKGDKVASVGLGPIGMFSALLFQAKGFEVVGLDLDENRIELLNSLGCKGLCSKDGLVETYQQVNPDGADIVCDATGVTQVLPIAINLAKDNPWDDQPLPQAKYIIQGSYPGDFSIPYQEAFMKELTFFLPRSDQPCDSKAVLELAAEGKLNLGALISDVRSPADCQSAFDDLKNRKPKIMTIAFDWSMV